MFNFLKKTEKTSQNIKANETMIKKGKTNEISYERYRDNKSQELFKKCLDLMDDDLINDFFDSSLCEFTSCITTLDRNSGDSKIWCCLECMVCSDELEVCIRTEEENFFKRAIILSEEGHSKLKISEVRMLAEVFLDCLIIDLEDKVEDDEWDGDYDNEISPYISIANPSKVLVKIEYSAKNYNNL